jgi:uncharacterized membrane protein YoaK (UPF0700 family)
MPYSHSQPIDRNLAHRNLRHLLPGACLLTATAGYINSAVLGFYRTPVSHMTGAVSHLGLDVAEGRKADALASLSSVVGFVLGALLAGLMIGAWKLVPGRRYGAAMMIEGALLALATGLLAGQSRLGLPAVAMACGLQNAMASSYCGLMIRTTHVTGTVTDIGVMLGHWIRHRQIQGWKLRFLCLLVLSFGVGGWIGAMAELKYGLRCLGIAAAGTTLAGGVFWFVTHRGLVDLVQGAAPHPPRTATFPEARG